MSESDLLNERITEIFEEARVPFEKGEVEKARKLYGKALKLGERSLDAVDAVTHIAVREALARCFNELRRFEEASTCDRESLDLCLGKWKEEIGRDDEFTVTIRSNLARRLAHHKPSALAEAIALHRKNIKSLERSPDSGDLLAEQHSLAFTLAKLGKDPSKKVECLTEAAKLYDRVTSARTDASEDPKKDPLVIEARHNHACVLLDLGKLEKAERRFRKNQDIIEKMSPAEKEALGPVRDTDEGLAACVAAIAKRKAAAESLRILNEAQEACVSSNTAAKENSVGVEHEDGPVGKAKQDPASSVTEMPSLEPQDPHDESNEIAILNSQAIITVNIVETSCSTANVGSSNVPDSELEPGHSAEDSGRDDATQDDIKGSDESPESAWVPGSIPEQAADNIDPLDALVPASQVEGSEPPAHIVDAQASQGIAESAGHVQDQTVQSTDNFIGPCEGLAGEDSMEDGSLAIQPASLQSLGFLGVGSVFNRVFRHAKSAQTLTESDAPFLSGTSPSCVRPKSATGEPTHWDAVAEPVAHTEQQPTTVASEASGSGRLFADPASAHHADEWFDKLRRFTRNLLHYDDPVRILLRERIRVAVIDSGVHRTDDGSSMRPDLVKSYQSLCAYKDFTGGAQDWTDSDPDCHGTNCASVLLQTAPHAELLIANVVAPCAHATAGPRKRPEVSAEHTAAAMAWALDQEVDIISMSFGFEHWHEEIDMQLHRAREAHVLVFAAPSNDGLYAEVGTEGAYPARALTVFGFCSSNGTGVGSGFNPPRAEDRANFMILGEGVGIRGNGTEQQRLTGNSFATPIAAGTAALVLDFVRMYRCSLDAKRRDLDFKRHEVMTAVFKMMSGGRETGTQGGDYYIVIPWRVLTIRLWRVREDVLRELEACTRAFRPFPAIPPP
ncbi:hypothetical protein LTR56_011608 [Elasticomyces elasticus]|nr:hypothetical protein LTR56_011608 [Elasticomyces elasticus]KAK3656963.1 hypothetical protein LTR22_009464 [Elasticomyces elasticus]KAK4908171.1 hypothetical protein LTR49_022897 [Elasticomyces elasticus]KAK5748151.1 hypothetical protein LTS12_021800 [Elasticomyces elasticus]